MRAVADDVEQVLAHAAVACARVGDEPVLNATGEAEAVVQLRLAQDVRRDVQRRGCFLRKPLAFGATAVLADGAFDQGRVERLAEHPGLDTVRTRV